MNNRERQIFFEILKSALWEHKADLCAFNGDWDWKNILKTFENQSLLGIVAETIMNLPEGVRPSTKQQRRLLKLTGFIIHNNQRLCRSIGEIFPLLQNAGCRPILLKGLGVASLYPKTCYRPGGDIDIYVGPERIDLSKQIIGSVVTTEELSQAEDEKHHYKIKIKGSSFEIHHHPGHAGNDTKRKTYEEYSVKAFESAVHDSIRLSSTMGIEVDVPNAQINAWYIFNHLLQHYSGSGVGLRQFCDWLMVLKNGTPFFSEEGNPVRSEKLGVGSESIDTKILAETLDYLGLTRAWKILSGILVYQLGLPAEKMPLFEEKMAKKSQSIVLDHIIEGKNFRFGMMPDGHRDPNFFKRLRNSLSIYFTTSRISFVISRTYPFRKFWRELKTGTVRLITNK